MEDQKNRVAGVVSQEPTNQKPRRDKGAFDYRLNVLSSCKQRPDWVHVLLQPCRSTMTKMQASIKKSKLSQISRKFEFPEIRYTYIMNPNQRIKMSLFRNQQKFNRNNVALHVQAGVSPVTPRVVAFMPGSQFSIHTIDQTPLGASQPRHSGCRTPEPRHTTMQIRK